jgi:tetratricopeptide (TPR) repeat protein
MKGGREKSHLGDLRKATALLSVFTAMVAMGLQASSSPAEARDAAQATWRDMKGLIAIDLPAGWRREPTTRTWGAAPEMNDELFLFSGEGQKIQISRVRKLNDPSKLLSEALKYARFGLPNAKLDGKIVDKAVNGSPACWAVYKGTWIGTGGIPGWAFCGGVADGEDGLFFYSLIGDDDLPIWKDKIGAIFDSIKGRSALASGGGLAAASPEETEAGKLRSYLDEAEKAWLDSKKAKEMALSGRKDVAQDMLQEAVKKMIALYGKVIELDPKATLAYLRRAESHIESGARDGYDKALADAEKVVTLDPGNKDIYPVRAEAWARKAEFALAERDQKRADEFLGKALADYEFALKEKPDSKDVLLRIGEIRRYRGELDLALAAFSRVYEKDEYNYELGDLIKDVFKDFERQGRPIECGGSPRTWKLAAEFHYYGRRYDQALRCYDRALDLGLKPGEIWYTRSRVYADKGDFDNALADADKLMKSGRPSMIDYKNRGEIYVKKGDLDKAISDFSTAIKLQLKDLKSDVVWEGKVGPLLDLYETRADTYAANKDWGRAIDDLKTIEKRLMDGAAKAVIFRKMAKVYQDMGDAKNAAIYLEKARALYPDPKR